MIPPRIVTERLLLRPFEAADFAAYLRAHQRQEVMLHLTVDGQPLDASAAWRSMAAFTGHWALRGFGSWAVALRDTGEWIGRAGLHQPEPWPETELGYLIDLPHQNKGYAREAGTAALKWAREELKKTRLVSFIRPGNAASAKVAQALGGTREPQIQLLGHACDVWAYTL